MLVPQRCVWVTPIKKGKFEILAANPEGDSPQIAIWKLKRQIPGDYSTYFSEVNILSGRNYNGTVKYRYFAIDVDDLDYEYAMTGSANQPYIAYMDIGANGGGSSTDKGEIKNLDFVTANGSTLTKLTDSDYKESNSLFSIDGTSTSNVSYFFRRVDATVFYYISNTSSGLSVSEIGSGTKKKASSQDCEN